MVHWPKPRNRPAWMSDAQYAASPEHLTLREAQVGGRILVTTLLETDSVHKAELNTLYQRRWGIELDFGCLKTALGMDVPARLQPDPPADGPGRRAQRTGAAAAELQTYRAAVERVELARPLPRRSGRCHAAVRSHRPGACRKSTRTKRATSAKATPQVLPMAEGSSTRGTTTQSESSNVASRQVNAIGSRLPPVSRSVSASRGPAGAPPAGARRRRRAAGA